MSAATAIGAGAPVAIRAASPSAAMPAPGGSGRPRARAEARGRRVAVDADGRRQRIAVELAGVGRKRSAQLGGERALLRIGVERGVDRLGHLLRAARGGQPPAERSARRSPARSRPVPRAARVLAAEALVQRQRKRVDVGGRAGPQPVSLLGRHIGERPDHRSGGRQGTLSRRSARSRSRRAWPPPAAETRMFSGFTSRWTTPAR